MIDGKLHDELTYKGKQIVVDTCDLGASCHYRYETMAYYPNKGDEIESVNSATLEKAKFVHAEMLKKYQGHEAAPLSGKYAKLRDDLKTALAATAYLEQTEDGGTCNFDSPAMKLPRWNSKKIEQAAEEAGCGAWKWELWGNARWVIAFRSSGQANRRSRRADALVKALSGMGYDCTEYCAMD